MCACVFVHVPHVCMGLYRLCMCCVRMCVCACAACVHGLVPPVYVLCAYVCTEEFLLFSVRHSPDLSQTSSVCLQNHAEDLKKVCLDFVSRNLAAVMATDGYR